MKKKQNPNIDPAWVKFFENVKESFKPKFGDLSIVEVLQILEYIDRAAMKTKYKRSVEGVDGDWDEDEDEEELTPQQIAQLEKKKRVNYIG